jgi:VCBS repeat-containing protein
VRLRTTDSGGDSFEKSFSLNVIDVEESPLTTNDSYDVPINYMAIIQSITGGVLANDSDSDGDAFTAELIDPPAHGTLTFNNDGTFRYRPDANATQGQIETFTYRVIDDSGLASTGTVSLTISTAIISPFHNQDTPTDVALGSNPGTTSALDVLAVINILNMHRGRVSVPVEELVQPPPVSFYYDVNNDFLISALDILGIINFVNARLRSGEGESGSQKIRQILGTQPSNVNLIDAAIVDLTDLPNKKRT